MMQSYVGTNTWPTPQVPCQTLSLHMILQRLLTVEVKHFYVLDWQSWTCGHEIITKSSLQFERVTGRESRVHFYCVCFLHGRLDLNSGFKKKKKSPCDVSYFLCLFAPEDAQDQLECWWSGIDLEVLIQKKPVQAILSDTTFMVCRAWKCHLPFSQHPAALASGST